MQSTAKKLKLPMDKVIVTVDQHGNTSAASIPLALDAACARARSRQVSCSCSKVWVVVSPGVQCY
jgi:3-oxoacyl-[acyl-carrier-protein] synthase-3